MLAPLDRFSPQTIALERSQSTDTAESIVTVLSANPKEALAVAWATTSRAEGVADLLAVAGPVVAVVVVVVVVEAGVAAVAAAAAITGATLVAAACPQEGTLAWATLLRQVIGLLLLPCTLLLLPRALAAASLAAAASPTALLAAAPGPFHTGTSF